MTLDHSTHDRWTDRLSEYLDGDMPRDDGLELEAHLETCPDCVQTLSQLSAVVQAARSAVDLPPPRDLWPVIERSLGGPDDIKVLSLTDRMSERDASASRWSRNVRLSVPQLVAAGLALAFFSGGGVWMLRPAPLADTPTPVLSASAPEAVSPALPVASTAGESETAEYAREVEELERVLDRYRDLLDPGTVRVVEKNLAVIDRAIEDSRRALETDPGNPYLEQHLSGSMRQKVEFLRETAILAERAS